jgi:DNA polymerase (family 10)
VCSHASSGGVLRPCYQDQDGKARAAGTRPASHLTDPAHHGITLLRATGSVQHLEQLETLAAGKDFTLDATGLHRGRKVIARSEADIYASLGLPFIEPELREGSDEIEPRSRTSCRS